MEEVLSGTSMPAQLSRRYSLSRGLVYHWENQYAKEKLNNELAREETLLDRIRKLEQMLGKLITDAKKHRRRDVKLKEKQEKR